MSKDLIITIVVSIIAILVAVYYGVKSLKKKKPAWAYKTTKVIGLDTKAPQELKLVFGDKVVPEVYRTMFIFLNKGNESIRQDDVTDKVTVHFYETNMLREPHIVATSKPENRVTTKQIVNENEHAVEIDFLYLDNNDGLVLEALHTKCKKIECNGNIIGAGKPQNIGEFILRFTKWFTWRRIVGIILGTMFPIIFVTVLVVSLEPQNMNWDFLLGMFVGCLLYIVFKVIDGYSRNTKFPKWSAQEE
jgi:hypothetical protein